MKLIQSLQFSCDQSIFDYLTLNILSDFKFYLDCTEGLFKKSKMNFHSVYVVKTKTRWGGFPKSKKRICNTVTSHVNSSESNNLNT